MLPLPLSITLKPKDNTTNCICCSSNTDVVNQNGRNTPPLADNVNRRMIPSKEGLIAEGDKKPSLFSCLDCFADVRDIKVNQEARKVFETYLTQQVGFDIANSIFSEHKWSKEGIPLYQKEIQELESEAKKIYKKTEGVASAFKLREVANLLIQQKQQSSPPQSPPQPLSITSQKAPSGWLNNTLKKSDDPKPLIVARSNRQTQEFFNPAKIADYIKQISPATEEQASNIADQIQVTFTYTHAKKPIESKDILLSLVEQLVRNNLPVNEPPPLSPKLSQYQHFNQIPIQTLKEISENN